MDNIQIVDIEDPFTKETTQHVIINRGNGEFTSMTKEVYDAMQEKLND